MAGKKIRGPRMMVRVDKRLEKGNIRRVCQGLAGQERVQRQSGSVTNRKMCGRTTCRSWNCHPYSRLLRHIVLEWSWNRLAVTSRCESLILIQYCSHPCLASNHQSESIEWFAPLPQPHSISESGARQILTDVPQYQYAVLLLAIWHRP